MGLLHYGREGLLVGTEGTQTLLMWKLMLPGMRVGIEALSLLISESHSHWGLPFGLDAAFSSLAGAPKPGQSHLTSCSAFAWVLGHTVVLGLPPSPG